MAKVADQSNTENNEKVTPYDGAQLKKKFEEYFKAKSAVDAVDEKKLAANKKMWAVGEDILNKNGGGPYNYNGMYYRLVKRKESVTLRLVSAKPPIEV
jgi:hypothetical protein